MNPGPMAPKEEAKQTEAKAQEDSTSIPVQQASSNMVEVLKNSTNPKHRNSEFLQFLNKLNSGALTIQDDNKLVEDEEKMKAFSLQEAERMKEEVVR